jgi:hypothetical protein
LEKLKPKVIASLLEKDGDALAKLVDELHKICNILEEQRLNKSIIAAIFAYVAHILQTFLK